jgi:hypothetical protein
MARLAHEHDTEHMDAATRWHKDKKVVAIHKSTEDSTQNITGVWGAQSLETSLSPITIATN